VSLLLDTCVVIDVLRGDTAAMTFVLRQTKPLVCSVTLLELYKGFRSKREEAVAERLLSGLTNVQLDRSDIWRRAGQHMKHYGPSHGLDDLDALIAATAEHHGLKLATLNVKHFPMLKGLRKAY
jgi:predicted nucleic acid-binding protein